MIRHFSARILGNTCATTNMPFNFALESAHKINNKEMPFCVFASEKTQMSALDRPDIAFVELFTATPCLTLHYLAFLTDGAKH